MTAIDTSIGLLEAEKRDLYGRMKALDDALMALRRIRSDLDGTPTRGAPKQPGEPARTLPGPKPRQLRGRNPRADVRVNCPNCKREFSQMGIGPHKKSCKSTGPTPALTAAKPSEPQISAVTQLVDRLAATKPRLGHCSCGKHIDDADAWAQHCRTVPGISGHRLIRDSEAS